MLRGAFALRGRAIVESRSSIRDNARKFSSIVTRGSINLRNTTKHSLTSNGGVKQTKFSVLAHSANNLYAKYYSTSPEEKDKKPASSNNDKKSEDKSDDKAKTRKRKPEPERSWFSGGGGSNLGHGTRASLLMVGGTSALLALIYLTSGTVDNDIDFAKFQYEYLLSGKVDRIEVYNKQVRCFTEGTRIPVCTLRIGDPDLFEEKVYAAQEMIGLDVTEMVPVTYMAKGAMWYIGDLVPSFLFLSIVAMLFVTPAIMTRYMSKSGSAGGGLFSVGKSKAKLINAQKDIKTRFDDVAGLDEAKVEIKEFVNFLKDRKKYEVLGAKIPRGALLVGPPGCGKTLLAKATAGEAGVPFFAATGSDFVEMFVGVGPARVRDMFKKAKQNAPCIIFIDEIDAVGKSRQSGGGQVNDERENTVNQLLVEMDGFESNEGIIVLAGTNRPEILDSALTRPGRFDRKISIDHPTISGRRDILKVHLEPVKAEKKDELAEKLATLTPGFSGADLANVCNEAALVAARKNKEVVELEDFEYAVERVVGGIEKKSKVLIKKEKERVAYHEAGHAVAGWFLEYAEALLKVSIVPRGDAALGYAMYQPQENFLNTEEMLLDDMCLTLGGRVAEEIIFNEISSGASNDLDKVTRSAYNQITRFGMNSQVGLVTYHNNGGEGYEVRPYSEATMELVDNEVRSLVNKALERTRALLRKHRDGIEGVAKVLLEKEVLEKEDMEKILGKRPFKEKRTFRELSHADEVEADEKAKAEKDKAAAEKKEEEKNEEKTEESTENQEKKDETNTK